MIRNVTGTSGKIDRPFRKTARGIPETHRRIPENGLKNSGKRTEIKVFRLRRKTFFYLNIRYGHADRRIRKGIFLKRRTGTGKKDPAAAEGSIMTISLKQILKNRWVTLFLGLFFLSAGVVLIVTEIPDILVIPLLFVVFLFLFAVTESYMSLSSKADHSRRLRLISKWAFALFICVTGILACVVLILTAPEDTGVIRVPAGFVMIVAGAVFILTFPDVIRLSEKPENR